MNIHKPLGTLPLTLRRWRLMYKSNKIQRTPRMRCQCEINDFDGCVGSVSITCLIISSHEPPVELSREGVNATKKTNRVFIEGVSRIHYLTSSNISLR